MKSKFIRGNNPRKSMEVGTYSSKLYYVVDENIYINLPDPWLPAEEGVEIHSRKDVYFVSGKPKDMKPGGVFINFDELDFPITDIVAYSQRNFHKDEIINS